jgi:O-antigen/teichoic acid export membrane protein
VSEVAQPLGDEPPGREEQDPAGQKRLLRNVLASWGAHLVTVVFGFIMPRMIDHRLGQVTLGIWDFAWSIVSYFALFEVGIGSSVNRFVALHRAEHDDAGVRRTVSSVMFIQGVIAALVLLVTATVCVALPHLFGRRLGDQSSTAQWVVALLGTCVAVQMAFNAFRGVITGCHRWDVHNFIESSSYVGTVVMMIGAVLAGGGLRALAAVYLAGVCMTEVARTVVAYRVCPELRIQRAYIDLGHARSLLVFGGKRLVTSLAGLVLVKGNSILVATALGPGTLAVYSRPEALFRVVEAFVNKFAFVLTPTASSLQARGRDKDVRDLLVTSTRYASFIALPPLVTLLIMGDQVLLLWMGPRYALRPVVVVLTAGYLLPVMQQPILHILTGLDLHGRAVILNLIAAPVGLALSVLAVTHLGWGLVGAAAALAFTTTMVRGIVLPLHACRLLSVPVAEYVRRGMLVPVLCVAPLALWLIAVRTLLAGPLRLLAVGLLPGLLLIVPMYWRYALPGDVRETLRTRALSRLRGRTAADRAS